MIKGAALCGGGQHTAGGHKCSSKEVRRRWGREEDDEQRPLSPGGAKPAWGRGQARLSNSSAPMFSKPPAADVRELASLRLGVSFSVRQTLQLKDKVRAQS